MTKEERRDVRRGVGRVSRFVLFYSILFTAAGFLAILGVAVAELAEDPETSLQAIEQLMFTRAGETSLASLAVGLAFVLLWRRGRLFTEDLRNPARRPMRWQVFAACIVLLFSCQLLSSIVDPLIRSIAEALGYSNYSSMDAFNDTPTTASLILYAGLFGPLMEEIVFRGVALSGLRRYGKVFAIVTSAFLFALFHSDLNQGIFAFAAGLIFAVVAMEYHIGWAVLLHIFNNFGLSLILGLLFGGFSEHTQNTLMIVVNIVIGGLGGALILWRNRAAIAAYLRENRAAAGTVRACWTTPSFLLFVALEVVMMGLAFTQM